MSNVERRVRRLELIHDAGARLIAVAVDANRKDGDVDAFLEEKGIHVTERDLVVCVLKRFHAKAGDWEAPELLYVLDR